MLTGFRVVHVFDISQTDGEELPDVTPRRLSGDVPKDLLDALEKRIAAEGFMLRREAITRPSCNGYADFAAREVVIKEDLSGAQTIKTMIHELAHVLLHQESALSARAVAEVEAESVAFVVCRALGLDTSGYSFAYVARWGAGDTEVIAATAKNVISTANDILGVTVLGPLDDEIVRFTARRPDRALSAIVVPPIVRRWSFWSRWALHGASSLRCLRQGLDVALRRNVLGRSTGQASWRASLALRSGHLTSCERRMLALLGLSRLRFERRVSQSPLHRRRSSGRIARRGRPPNLPDWKARPATAAGGSKWIRSSRERDL